MKNNGKIQEVLITPAPMAFGSRTQGYYLWADNVTTETILEVEGVFHVRSYDNAPNHFELVLDPRYDPEVVVTNLETYLLGIQDDSVWISDTLEHLLERLE